MRAYKILEYVKEEKIFISPIAKTPWQNGEMSAPDVPVRDPEVREHWIWACDCPDHNELTRYIIGNNLVVKVELRGEIIVNDNGVIQAEYAKIKEVVIETPLGAFLYASVFGGNDFLRKTASLDHRLAVRYAEQIDQAPHDITREGACKDPFSATDYAVYVDKLPRNDTRRAACKKPKAALFYAMWVDKCPNDLTRVGASKDPNCALEYAIKIDKCPHDITRAGACRDPFCAVEYAARVDKKERNDTLAAANKNEVAAGLYKAKVIEKRDIETPPFVSMLYAKMGEKS